jgi:hypothetical protein
VDEVSADLQVFLDTFVNHVFPELRGREFHVAGESFGGLQAISLTHALVHPLTPWPKVDLKLKSLIVTSSFLDGGYLYASQYDVLCGRSTRYLNRTECGIMAEIVPRCERAALLCRMSASDADCTMMTDVCDPMREFWIPPKHNLVKRKSSPLVFCTEFVFPVPRQPYGACRRPLTGAEGSANSRTAQLEHPVRLIQRVTPG